MSDQHPDTPAPEVASLADIQFMRLGRDLILFRLIASDGVTVSGQMTENALDLLLNRAVNAKTAKPLPHNTPVTWPTPPQ